MSRTLRHLDRIPDPERITRARKLAEHNAVDTFCRGKVQHPDRNEAKRQARLMTLRKGKLYLDYHCPRCGLYHIGAGG